MVVMVKTMKICEFAGQCSIKGVGWDKYYDYVYYCNVGYAQNRVGHCFFVNMSI